MARIYPNYIKCLGKQNAVNPAVLIAADLKLPRLRVAQLFIKGGKSHLFGGLGKSNDVAA